MFVSYLPWLGKEKFNSEIRTLQKYSFITKTKTKSQKRSCVDITIQATIKLLTGEDTLEQK